MTEGELGRLYADGEIIFREGDRGEVMYVIQSGKVRITKNTPTGEITITTLKSGEIFGEMALFDKLPRSANVIAEDTARILSVDRKKLFTTISRDPTLVFKMVESMSKRIRGLNEELSKLREAHPDLLGMHHDVTQTCRKVLEEAQKIIKAENGSLMLLDDDGETLSIKAAFGSESHAKMKLRKGVGIAGAVLSTGNAEMVNNAKLDSRFVDGVAQIKSLLCVPLKTGDVIFGVMNMSNNPVRLFTIEDLKLLVALSLYASVAIQNAKNYSKLKLATDEILRHADMMF